MERAFNQKSVSPLAKVTLGIQAVPRKSDGVTQLVKNDLSLIYGIGPEGVCAFEKLLFEKVAGDQFAVPVDIGADAAIFGHLYCSLAQAIRISPPYTLHVTVQSVAPASNREVVKAMAQSTGCAGDCGCGCGG